MHMLTLFRHAKSSWDFPELEDFDRPLNERGINAARKMAAFLAERGLVPGHILCSSARRTCETLDLLLDAWNSEPEVDYAEALYLASEPTLLAIARDAPARADHVMIIGHNPGLEGFARHLTGSGDHKARYAMASKFPTAAAAVLTFNISAWPDLSPGAGHLSLFMTPRMLK